MHRTTTLLSRTRAVTRALTISLSALLVPMSLVACDLSLTEEHGFDGDEPGEDCGAVHEECLANEGEDAELCHEILLECEDPKDPKDPEDPKDPGFECEQIFIECIELWEVEPAVCEEIFGQCIGEDPKEPEEPEPGEECEQLFFECVDVWGEDPALCEELFHECVGEGPEPCPEPEPWPEPGEGCELELHECLEWGEDPDLCHVIFEECVGGGEPWPEPEPPCPEPEPEPEPPCPEPEPGEECEGALHECLEGGEDPDLCHVIFEECVGGEPWPEPDPDEDPQLP